MKGFFNNEKGFGVEIEFLRPIGKSQSTICRKIQAHVVFQAQQIECKRENWNKRTVPYWKCVTDSSVRAGGYNPNHTGDNELVSPILFGQKGKAQLKAVLQVLREQGCEVNVTCGIHVHHDITETMLAGLRIAKKVLKNLIGLVVKYEHVIYNLMPASRLTREYSQPARKFISYKKETISRLVNRDLNRHYAYQMNAVSIDNRKAQIQSDRYSGLNLQNIYTRGSVEFRYMQGSLNFSKVWSWVVMTQAIVTTAERVNSVSFTKFSNDVVESFWNFKRAIGFVGGHEVCADTAFSNSESRKKLDAFTTPECIATKRENGYGQYNYPLVSNNTNEIGG